MDLDSRKVETCLTSKLRCTKRNGDHIFFDLIEDGEVIATTKMSHGREPLGEPLQGAMAKQLGVPKQVFRDAVRCTVSRQQFIEARNDRLN